MSIFQTILDNQIVTASGSAPIDNDGHEIALFWNIAGAITGTAPTIQFTISEIDPFDNITVIGQTVVSPIINANGVGHLIMSFANSPSILIAWTVGGDSPSFEGVSLGAISRDVGNSIKTDSPSVGLNDADNVPASSTLIAGRDAFNDLTPIKVLTDGSIFVAQTTASNLRTQTSSEVATGSTTPANAALAGGAVTSAAPAYTNGKLGALSLTTAGALRTDASSVVQPVSGIVVASQGGSGLLNNAWATKITDAVNGPVAVKAAYTPATVVDPALVVTNAAIATYSTPAPHVANFVAGLSSANIPSYLDGTLAPLSITAIGGALRVDILGVAQSAPFDINNRYLLTGGHVTASPIAYADGSFNMLSLNTLGALRVDVQGSPTGSTWNTGLANVISGALVSSSGQTWAPGTVAPLTVNPSGGALRVEGAIVQGGQTAAVKAPSNPALATDPALVVALSPNNPLAITAPALAKGVQGTTGWSVQELKDAGRVLKTYSATNVTGATSETLFSLIAYADFVSSGAAFSFGVTPGKKLRLQSMVLTWRNGTANAGAVQVRFRVNNGLVVVGSPSQFALMAEATLATTGHGSTSTLVFPDGFELSGNMQFGLTQLASGAVAGFDVSVVGYEY